MPCARAGLAEMGNRIPGVARRYGGSKHGFMADPTDIPIDDAAIRLGQFLKLANLIESGSEAKTVIAAGLVRVNDEVELRRGRQLHDGDVVALAGHFARVQAQPA